MPGSSVVTPPLGAGSELYTGVTGLHGGGGAHTYGLGNPAKGSPTWAWPEFTGMVNQGPVAWPVTSRGYGASILNLEESVWSFSVAASVQTPGVDGAHAPLPYPLVAASVRAAAIAADWQVALQGEALW